MSKKIKDVYLVPKPKGAIEFCPLEEALKDIETSEPQMFTREVALQMLENGETPFSATKYYNVDFKPLEQYEDKDAKPAGMGNVEGENVDVPQIQVGDIVTKPDKVGEVVANEDGSLKVRFYVKGKERTQPLTTGKKGWTKLENQETALTQFTATVPVLHVAEPETPLTEEEAQRFGEIEAELDDLKRQVEHSIPLKIGSLLLEVQTKRLHRATGKTFEQYVKDRFGYRREYASELARYANFNNTVEASRLLSDGGNSLSVKTAQAFVKQSNALATSIGLDEVSLEVFKPVLQSTIELVVDVAGQENRVVTPMVVESVNKVIREVVTTKTVTIDGESMTIDEAKEKGVFSEVVQNEILESVAEKLKANKDYVIQESRKAFERQTTPVTGGGTAQSKEVYEGKIPRLKTSCSVHGAQDVRGMGNGTIQLMCNCRFRVDSVTHAVTCFEADGKKVVIPSK